MPNLFDALDKARPTFEEWGGQFDCRQPGCRLIADVAKYFVEEHKLIWKCDNGHVTQIAYHE